MNLFRNVILFSLLMPFATMAGPIIVTFDGPDAPGELGGYTMTDFADPTCPNDSCPTTAYQADSPIDGSVAFQTKDGDPLGMTVYDPLWWEFDHGNVYTTSVHWVELIMPAYTNAFSFFVGASFSGYGWIEATDSNGDTYFEQFSVSAGTTPGFGVYTSDVCSSITKVIVEPYDWGIGDFAINQGQDSTCVAIPEPAPVGLFGIGLLALALSRKYFQPARQS